AAGVTEALLPAVDLATGETALALAEKYPGRLLVALGYHPHEAKDLDDRAFQRIEDLLAAGRVAAVGEIGLDFYRLLSPADVQVRVFERMLDLAERTGLPVVVHCREAVEWVKPVLSAWAEHARSLVEYPLGVLHYFSEDVATAEHYVDLGFLISVH